MTLSNQSFVDPLDKDYDPLVSRFNGRNIFNKLVTWELSVKDLKIVLTNSHGAIYELGKLAKPVKSCSLAFLYFKTPYFVIEYLDGETVLFKIDLNSSSVKSLDVNFSNFKSVSITYNKAIIKDGLTVAAIGPDGVYRGTLVDTKLALVKVSSLDNPNKFRIHRFGLNTTNALSIELVELVQESI